MQTFLPYASFDMSAYVLDRQRLGKQRVETLQILKVLHENGRAWSNHPAVRMWRGRECALFAYQEAVVAEWTSRGYRDTCLAKSADIHYAQCEKHDPYNVPKWFGDITFHDSHKSNLLRKNPEWYGRWNWPVLDDLEYVWPV